MRDIATAHSRGSLIYVQDADNRIAGAATFKVLEADSRHKDFCGRTCVLRRGSLFVQHLGVRPEAAALVVSEMLGVLGAIASTPQTWLEVHEENRSLREQIEGKAGFAYVFTKIMASSDIRGMYVRPTAVKYLPTLPQHEIPTLLCLDSAFINRKELSALRGELLNYLGRGNAWGQHYSHYNKRRSWTAFAIRGYAPADPTFIIKPAEMSKAWKVAHPQLLTATCSETVAGVHFPSTLKVLTRIPGKKERIRFMRLAPGNGELSRHADITDQNAGTSDGCITRLHIPLITHKEVIFEGWGLRGEHEQMHFATGGLYYIDQRKPHRVINNSPVERIHLVVDVHSSEQLREWLYTSKLKNAQRSNQE